MLRRNGSVIVNKIQIRDFTVFKALEVDFSSGINLFIGENGTGKTHLLKILYSYLSGHGYEKVFGCKKENLCTQSQSFCKITVNGIEEDVSAVGFDDDIDVRSNNVFMPAKDMLTHSRTMAWLARDYRKTMAFDQVLIDTVHKALRPHPDIVPELAKLINDKFDITEVIGGEVIEDNEEFFIRSKSDEKITSFFVVAEGHKKLGLLWQLLMNGSIAKNAVILWDEPEANINPKLIPELVEVILELSRQGVQVFIATHDYVFAKYTEVKMREDDGVLFHALYQAENGMVKLETSENFRNLKNNAIITAEDKLLDEAYFSNMED